MDTPAPHAHRHIAGLDGLRAISVVIVIAAHAGLLGWLPSGLQFLLSGRTGVEIFFVLSGFLITRLLIEEHTRRGHISLKHFYMRRFLRILPAYWVFMGLVSILALVGFINIHPLSLTLAWVHGYNFVHVDYYSGIFAHTWSLAVEEHFYLLWPIALSLCLKASRAGAVCLGAVVAWILVCMATGLRAFSGEPSDYLLSWWTIPASGSIAIGALLAILSSRGWFLAARSPGRRLSYPAIVALCGAAVLLGVSLLCPAWDALSPLQQNLLHWCRSFTIGAMLITVVHCPRNRLGITMLEWAPLCWLGKISYGVYLWQGFFLTTGPKTQPGQSWPLDPAIAVPLTLVFATASYYLWERRFLKLKSRFQG